MLFLISIFRTGKWVYLSCWCHVLEAEQVPRLLLVIAIILVARVPELGLTLLAAIYVPPNKVSALLISNSRLTFYSQYDIEHRPHFMRGF